MKKALFALLAASLALPAAAQSNTPSVGIGVSIGEYFPSDTTIRKAFSDNIFTWGIAPVAFGRPNANTITPNFAIIGADENGSNFLLIPVGVGYEIHFGQNTGPVVPYARVDAGACYFNFSVNTPGGTTTGSDIGASGDAEIGVEFQKNWRLSAKYYLFTRENGLNFDGLQISLTFGLIHF